MLTRRAVARWMAGVSLALGTLGCAASPEPPSLGGGGAASGQGSRGIPTACVVAAPFEIAPQIRAPEGTRELLAAYLVEALGGVGLRVITPQELAPFLAAEGGPDGRERVQRIAFAADREFGCNVIALGRLDRFRERSGGASGSTQPSSVAFDLRFVGAPSGATLYTGRFDETQKALTENLLRARRYPGGGFRWLTANEFARWGVAEVVRGAPLSPRG